MIHDNFEIVMKFGYSTLGYLPLHLPLHLLAVVMPHIFLSFCLSISSTDFSGWQPNKQVCDTEISKKGEIESDQVRTYGMFVLFFFFRTVESTLIFAGSGHC